MKDKTKETVISSFRLFKTGVEEASKPLLAYLSSFSPEALKDEDVQKDYMNVMAQFQALKSLGEQTQAMIEVLEAPPKPKEGEAISSFGFMSDIKKAA